MRAKEKFNTVHFFRPWREQKVRWKGDGDPSAEENGHVAEGHPVRQLGNPDVGWGKIRVCVCVVVAVL